MDQDGRDRAAAAFRKAMSAKGLSPHQVALRGDIPDAATVRTFMEGNSWPWAKTRKKLEDAVDMAPGSLDAIARGEAVAPADEEDRVVAAIAQSDLTRAQKAKLTGTYYEMLDQQGEAVRGA